MDRELRRQLPVTRALGAGNLDFTLMGLKGFSWLYVFVAAMFVQMATDHFLVALGGGLLAYGFIRTFIDAKPRDWLRHALEYHCTLPRRFVHRPNRRSARSLAPRTP